MGHLWLKKWVYLPLLAYSHFLRVKDRDIRFEMSAPSMRPLSMDNDVSSSVTLSLTFVSLFQPSL